jgi:hypothetical protein
MEGDLGLTGNGLTYLGVKGGVPRRMRRAATAMLGGHVRLYWILDGPPSFGPLGTDLLVFAGWPSWCSARPQAQWP